MDAGVAMGLWQWLAAAGGTVALVFIVAIVIALAVMTAVFLGSAVVVLERFARVWRSPLAVAGFALLLSAAAAAVNSANCECAAPDEAGSSWGGDRAAGERRCRPGEG